MHKPKGQKRGEHKSSFTAVIELKYCTWVYLSLSWCSLSWRTRLLFADWTESGPERPLHRGAALTELVQRAAGYRRLRNLHPVTSHAKLRHSSPVESALFHSKGNKNKLKSPFAPVLGLSLFKTLFTASKLAETETSPAVVCVLVERDGKGFCGCSEWVAVIKRQVDVQRQVWEMISKVLLHVFLLLDAERNLLISKVLIFQDTGGVLPIDHKWVPFKGSTCTLNHHSLSFLINLSNKVAPDTNR